MRMIDAQSVTDTVARLCVEANYYVGGDIRAAIESCMTTERNACAKDVLEKLIENADIAAAEKMAICQDTGMAVVFVTVGQEAHVSGNLRKAVNAGVRKGYREGYLRSSVVADPLKRVNTGDNTPAVIHFDVSEGDNIEIIVAPKGFGSENMSRVRMLMPSDGEQGVMDFVVETVRCAGGNPCPPLVVGVGVGGTMEQAALLAKKALLLPLNHQNDDRYYANMENILLERINALGIGPMGWGGDTTALGVNILTYPTHIAGLPVAVNISCHVTRHAKAVI